jgi:hypothetical protein
MSDVFQVSDTLTLELVPEAQGSKARLVRLDGGIVVLELSELEALASALYEVRGRLAAREAGEPYEDSLF